MSLEWIVTGIILLGGMLAGGISLYIKRKKVSQADSVETEIHHDLAESENDEK